MACASKLTPLLGKTDVKYWEYHGNSSYICKWRADHHGNGLTVSNVYVWLMVGLGNKY